MPAGCLQLAENGLKAQPQMRCGTLTQSVTKIAGQRADEFPGRSLIHTYNYTEYIISANANNVNSFYINLFFYLPGTANFH